MRIYLRSAFAIFLALFISTCGGGGDDGGGGGPWTKLEGTSLTDQGNGVAVDSSGNIYITGSTMGGLDGNANAGNSDIFLIKYNSAGTKQWTRQLGTSATDTGNGVAVDRSGNVYVTGATFGGLDGNTNAGDSDIFLVKYDSAGTKQWTRQLGTTTTDFGNGVALDSGGNAYITGYAGGGLDGIRFIGGGDIFVLKYSSSGVKQ